MMSGLHAEEMNLDPQRIGVMGILCRRASFGDGKQQFR